MNQSSEIGFAIKFLVFVFFVIWWSDTVFAAQVKVVGFGDSITAGWPYVTSDQNGSTAGGYEPPLNTLLSDKGWNVTVLNYGHPGELSFEGDDRIQAVLNKQTPDWVLILEGTNDLLWLSPNTVMTNLDSMVNKVRNEGLNVVLATLTPDNRGSKPITYMNLKIRSYADKNNVPLADQYMAVASDWNNLVTSDKLHPNRAGYSVMATTWFDTIIANSGKGNISAVLMLLLRDK